jgi:hypothetical protein
MFATTPTSAGQGSWTEIVYDDAPVFALMRREAGRQQIFASALPSTLMLIRFRAAMAISL